MTTLALPCFATLYPCPGERLCSWLVARRIFWLATHPLEKSAWETETVLQSWSRKSWTAGWAQHHLIHKKRPSRPSPCKFGSLDVMLPGRNDCRFVACLLVWTRKLSMSPMMKMSGRFARPAAWNAAMI